MKSNLFKSVICVWVGLIALVACSTDVDLCPQTQHPHLTPVVFRYDWSQDQRPDTMFVIANRVINTWKYSLAVDTKTEKGRFIHNEDNWEVETPETPDEPETPEAPDEPETPETPDEPETPETPDEPETPETPDEPVAPEMASAPVTRADEEGGETEGGVLLDEFPLRSGPYKFSTFVIDSTEIVYSDVDRFINSPANEMSFSEICLEYKTYEKTDPGLRGILADWDDYNPYALYIQPDITPVWFDSIPTTDIQGLARTDIRFTPRPLSQNIDLYFNITKIVDVQPFVIDSVTAELGGIPIKINLSNGYIDITKTCKMMFKMELLNSSGEVADDQLNNGSVKCHANINVTSIVHGVDNTVRTGPGIMQVIIHTHCPAPNDPVAVDGIRHKRIQGKINLYNTLQGAGLIEYLDGGKYARRKVDHADIHIKSKMVIDGSSILYTPSDDGGVDRWLPCGDVIVDI